MAEISLCMIVKDEEDVLARCLNSVAHLCDEIIIVDTGSTDRTKEIARTFTDNVYDFQWIDDFSAARARSITRGRHQHSSCGEWPRTQPISFPGFSRSSR